MSRRVLSWSILTSYVFLGLALGSCSDPLAGTTGHPGSTVAAEPAAPEAPARVRSGTAPDAQPAPAASSAGEPPARTRPEAARTPPEPEPTAEPEPEPKAAREPEPEPEREPEAAAPAELEPAYEQPLLYATAREVFVYDRPSLDARKLGYLRAGAVVPRSEKAEGFRGCRGGFYRVAPEGYVCIDTGARLQAGHAVTELVRVRPDRLAALPYTYGRARTPLPPFYTKLPSPTEQREIEPELGRVSAPSFAALPSAAVPQFLSEGRRTPTPFGYRRDPSSVALGRALANSSFALLSVFDHGDRRFALTSDLTLLPLDRLERVNASGFHGLALDGARLPVAFVQRRGALLYRGKPTTGLALVRPLAYREAVLLSGVRARIGKSHFLETAAGDWIADERLIRVEPPVTMPAFAKPGKRWIHVSIGTQTLVAYDGVTPAYVTLVSTGIDGLGDPTTTHSTVQGDFLIHTKHVTATMDSDAVGDEYDLRDVPWVQYFSDNYAFHAAYWHDAFGAPRSHGCINLSPLDARWLFQWTLPSVPQLWHGAFSLLGGTVVHITP